MDNFNDEHNGKGGSYVIDADGKRVLQARTGYVPPPTPKDTPAPAGKTKPQVKGTANAKSN